MRLTGFSVFSLHAAYAASHFRAEILLLIHRGCQIPISRVQEPCLQAIYPEASSHTHAIPRACYDAASGRNRANYVRNTRETRREILLV
ncbi:hypothetical protein T12_5358 [Trichinella patagoniensis]|uniref:Uncharacterized protein n=1 Tax=Trichinella patagoniensis TaxID=990121 RepID=A0A0V0ZCF9_9BILA|nr:hypothetical protein T12_5358 [Trichinella patagoniensis]